MFLFEIKNNEFNDFVVATYKRPNFKNDYRQYVDRRSGVGK